MSDKKTTATELTKAQSTEVGQVLTGLEAFAAFATNGAIIGLEEISSEDIKMPKVKLIQPTSAEANEKGVPGQYLNVTTGQAFDFLYCTLLAFGKSRVRWPAAFKRGEDPECKSYDGVYSDSGDVACKDCEYQVWNDNERPECGQVYAFMGLLPDGSPFRMVFAGAQLTKIKDFLTEVKLRRLPMFIYKIRLVSTKQSNEKGTYFTTEITLLKDDAGQYLHIDPADFGKYEEETVSLQNIFSVVRAADLVSSDSKAPDDEKIF